MKRNLIRLVIGMILLVVGFMGGRYFQRANGGYYFKVQMEKEYPFTMGTVRLRFVTESVGFPLLDPGTSIIEFRDRTIYKAKRYFQESVPVARNIQTSDKSIDWDDGEYAFHLTIEEMKKQTNGINQ